MTSRITELHAREILAHQPVRAKHWNFAMVINLVI